MDPFSLKKSKPYSLSKARRIFDHANQWYKKSWRELFTKEIHDLEEQLDTLDTAIVEKDRDTADKLARELEKLENKYYKKTPLEYTWEIFCAVVIALVLALVVRQMWFEPYSIPTGSMRPTYREQDHLFVTKTAFGINIPAFTQHFYFDTDLIKRTDVVIWSGDGIDLPDTNTSFLLFPYKKRYIKRLMGKPGDTLYFYGGKVYGIDKDGKNISEEFNHPWMNKLDHIPFISFEGERVKSKYNEFSGMLEEITFRQMNLPIGRLRLENNEIIGEVFNGKEWTPDQIDAARKPHANIQTYGDFFGMSNYAKARLLTKDQVTKLTPYNASEMEDGLLYLELRHTPSLSENLVKFYPLSPGREALLLIPQVSVIPLKENHLEALMNQMYTIRFEVKNGQAFPYDAEGLEPGNRSPFFANVEDGTYEFYNGKAYKVGIGGYLSELPAKHPLYLSTTNNIQKLFNLGIELNTDFSPGGTFQRYPSRYAYFKDGDLYVMGGKTFDKEDPLLQNFLKRELDRESRSNADSPQIAFRDKGAPTEEQIKAFGVQVPEGHYLVLGDNHARSADSRIFGFVPEENIQGAPTYIFWPPGERFGVPAGRSKPLLPYPRMIVWSLIALIGVGFGFRHYRHMHTKQFAKVSNLKETNPA